MLELLKSSTYAIVFGDRVTYYPQNVTIDCNLATEIAIYDAVVFRLSGSVCPVLENVETEKAIYQGKNGGIVYSFCQEFDR